MLDYTKEDENTKTFISKFWKTEDALVVESFAKGQYKLAKTKENEDYLIYKEEEQAKYVLNSVIKDALKKDKELIDHTPLLFFNICVFPVWLGLAVIIAFANEMKLLVFPLFGLIEGSVCFLSWLYKKSLDKKMQVVDAKIEGIDKMEYYMENKKTYQSDKKLEGKLLIGLKQSDADKLGDCIDTPILDTININTIDNFSLETLEQLKTNIINYEEYQEKSKTLRKR